jgi:hypothetical protein
MYPKWDFWFENKPSASGNPVRKIHTLAGSFVPDLKFQYFCNRVKTSYYGKIFKHGHVIKKMTSV